MGKTIEVTFPGGKKVDAKVGTWTVNTDQSERHGGGETAPEPFQLFLASLATCSGIFALEFCTTRKIPTEGLGVTLHAERDPEQKRYTRMTTELRLPDGFPEKYEKAIKRAVDLCSVKKHILDPPEFTITTTMS